MDNKSSGDRTIEIQHQIRQNAMKMQEEFKSMKNFEQEIKMKEEDMLKKAAMNVTTKENVSYEINDLNSIIMLKSLSFQFDQTSKNFKNFTSKEKRRRLLKK